MKDTKKWLIGLGYGVLVVLLAHFYAQYRLANTMAVGAMQSLRQSNDYINNQCVTLLGRQGFQVTKTPPLEEEPQDDAQR